MQDRGQPSLAAVRFLPGLAALKAESDTDNGYETVAYVSGRVKKNRIRILAGNRFTRGMMPHDLNKGRINFRRKDERAAVPGTAAWRSFRRPSTRAAPMPPKCPKARRAG